MVTPRSPQHADETRTNRIAAMAAQFHPSLHECGGLARMATTTTSGVRKRIPTYCYQCVNGPDVLKVEVVDGVATKVEPNFDACGVHPADGKICVKPYGLIQKIYNPNRLLTPLKRTNPKKI